jgi:amidase
MGLPIGLAFMSRPYTEAQLLSWGYAYEQATRARKAPTYRPTVED